MSRQTITPKETTALLARTARFIGERAETHVCDIVQATWSDVQRRPLAIIHLATMGDLPEGGKSPVEQFHTFPEAKIFARYTRGGRYLLREKNRPTALEAVRALGAMAAACPLDIYRACISAADAFAQEETKLTLEIVAPTSKKQQTALERFAHSFTTSLQTRDNSYDMLVQHQGTKTRLYAAQLLTYPLA